VFGAGDPPENVATADDDPQLDAEFLDLFELLRDGVAGLRRNAIIAGTQQRFAAQLQHHPPIFQLRG